MIFKEVKLPNTFCKEYRSEVEEYIKYSKTFTMVGMPAGSTSLFLKYIASKEFAHFIYIDMYSLPTISKKSFFSILLRELGGNISNIDKEDLLLDKCRERLKKLSAAQKKIVIIINRFEELKLEFDKNFFGQLRSLTHINDNKVVLIFSVYKPYSETAPHALEGGNLQMFSQYIYFRPLNEMDLLSLLSLHSPELITNTEYFNKAVKLSGGHLQLLQLLLKTERIADPLLDPYINLLFKELTSYLTYKQRKTIEKIAFGKAINEIDEYLLNVGYVFKSEGKYMLFSPLLSKYIKDQSSFVLPVKEKKLFTILKKNIGRVVAKDQIFEFVWNNESDNATDWALDSLIYRLRKNYSFKKSGYIIENNKKVGYRLIKN